MESSSGKHQGQLKITKRGPSVVRRWLFFSALRLVQRGPIRGWFEAKKKKDKDRGLGGVVAVMRKLALAVHATVTNDELFQLAWILPGKPIRKPPIKSENPIKNDEVIKNEEPIKNEKPIKNDEVIKSKKPIKSKKLFGQSPKDFEFLPVR